MSLSIAQVESNYVRLEVSPSTREKAGGPVYRETVNVIAFSSAVIEAHFLAWDSVLCELFL